MAAAPFHRNPPQSWSAPTSVQASRVLSPDRAAAALQTQIEFYFSPQNLSSDTYLRAQMDADGFVRLSLIADFKLVRKLTNDVSEIVDAVRRSKLLELDSSATLIRAALKPASRTTIILRDIAADTPLADVERIFDDDDCAPIVSIRADIADTWFVSFADEESCIRTAEALLDKTFAGSPIRFRVKSENLVRSFRHAPPPSPSMFQQQRPVWNIRRGNCVPVWEGMPMFGPPIMPISRRYNNNPVEPPPRRKVNNNNHSNNARKPLVANNNQHHHHPGQVRPRKPKVTTTMPRPKQEEQQQVDGVVVKEQQPELGPEHFPALPSSKTPASSPTRNVVEPLSNPMVMERMEESVAGGHAAPREEDEDHLEGVVDKTKGDPSYASIARRAKGTVLKPEGTMASLSE